jgi:hypothetical protein
MNSHNKLSAINSPTPTDQSDLSDQIRIYIQQWFPDFNYRKRDDLFFAALKAEFPSVDLLNEIKSFHAWCLDRNDNDSLNYRLTFRKWLANAVKGRKPR